MEWMSSIDSSFLHVENDVTPMHIGGVSIFEGPPPPFEDLQADGRGQARPRPPLPPEGPLRAARRPARPRGSTTPTSASTTTCATPRSRRPAARSSCATWRRACSPSTSTATSRCGSCGRSRASPDGRWALLSKVHHCMVDGVAATDLMSVMFSDTTGSGPRGVSSRRRRSPPSVEVLAQTLAHKLSPAGQLQTLQRALRAPARNAAHGRARSRGRRPRRARACARSPRPR